MLIQELVGGGKLHGTTGNGKQLDKKGNRAIVFASHLTDKEKQNSFASFRVREGELIKLWHLIDELEE